MFKIHIPLHLALVRFKSNIIYVCNYVISTNIHLKFISVSPKSLASPLKQILHCYIVYSQLIAAVINPLFVSLYPLPMYVYASDAHHPSDYRKIQCTVDVISVFRFNAPRNSPHEGNVSVLVRNLSTSVYLTFRRQKSGLAVHKSIIFIVLLFRADVIYHSLRPKYFI